VSYSAGLTWDEVNRIERSVRRLTGWRMMEAQQRTEGRWNVNLFQRATGRKATLAGPGGYEDFLDAEGHKADCACPACEQWNRDSTAAMNLRVFGDERGPVSGPAGEQIP
jgi:hypothetical protein